MKISGPLPGRVRPEPRADVDGYLARLGLDRPRRPDRQWLFAAHRAHMARVPYENLEIQSERPTTVDPVEAIARIARGRACRKAACGPLTGVASVRHAITKRT